METKICSKCGEEKPISEFREDKRVKCRLSPMCKYCFRKRDKEYRELNKEMINKSYRKFYAQNREKVLAWNKKYVSKNREKSNASSIAHRKRNKDRYREYDRKRSKKRVQKLEDNYIIDIAARQFDIPQQEIRQNPELIQLKRLEIALKRRIKQIKN